MGVPFVVTGCGRSGTMYTSFLFRELGLRCGHEAIFHPSTAVFGGFGPADGDSSWLAVPFLDSLPPNTVVLHQVRHPFSVCASFTAMAFFEPGPVRLLRRDRQFVKFLRTHHPEAYATGDPRWGAARHWIDWNRRVEADARQLGLPYLRFRIDDMTHDGWIDILRAIGSEPSRAALDAALATVPTTINSYPSEPFDPGGLPAPLRAEMAELAVAYGYSESTQVSDRTI